MSRRASGELMVSDRCGSLAVRRRRTQTPRKSQSLVLVELTGRVQDAEERAVRAWAASKCCDFRNGARLAVLLESVTAHNDETGGDRLDISTRILLNIAVNKNNSLGA